MNGVNIEISHNKIAERAYEIYLKRQDLSGDTLSDWLRAEAELKSELIEQLSKDTVPARKNITVAKPTHSGKSSKVKGARNHPREASF